jgi:hypothetical protein
MRTALLGPCGRQASFIRRDVYLGPSVVHRKQLVAVGGLAGPGIWSRRALDGNICALLAAKEHVNVFIYDPIAPDPAGIINQGHGNLTARSVQIRRGEPINKRALINLFRAVIANNRAGGWRKISGR